MEISFSRILFFLFLAATVVQLIAWRRLYARLARYPDPASPESGPLPPLSVLICARNAAEYLQVNLPGILEQDYPDFEVLVIDDDSDDHTQAVLQHFARQYPNLRALRNSPKTSPGKKQALRLGIRQARHERLVLTDADCRPVSTQWLRALVRRWAPGVDIVLGYGPYRPAPGFLNRWIRYETAFTALQYFSMALAGRPYMGVGRNLAWRRALFHSSGGFTAHEHLASGDDDLMVNAAGRAGNTVICLEPDAFVYSEPERSWPSWRRQKRRHLSASHYYRSSDKRRLAALAISQSLHYFLLTTLLFTDFGIISATFYAIRMASAFPVIRKTLCRLREEQLIVWFPLFDALQAFYFAVFVPLSLLRSHYLISWK